MLQIGFLFIAIFPLLLGTLFAQSPIPSPTTSYSESKSYVPRESEKIKGQKQGTDQPTKNGNGSLTLAVAIYDNNGQEITGLQIADFSVFVDGTEVEVTAMKAKPKSVDLILLLDRSPSVETKKDLVQKVSEQIVDHIQSQDTVTVVGFGLDSKVAIEQSTDKPAILKAIRNLGTGDGTSLYNAVLKLANTRQGVAADPTALIVVSDAVDTTSKHSSQESLIAAEQSNLVVFWVYLDTLQDFTANIRQLGGYHPRQSVGVQLKDIKRDYQKAADYVNDILTLSGGLVFYPTGEVDIAREMRDRYYLTVHLSKDLTPNERHSLKVRVKRPGLHVLSKATLVN